jgi:hypothetical protein
MTLVSVGETYGDAATLAGLLMGGTVLSAFGGFLIRRLVVLLLELFTDQPKDHHHGQS